MNRTQPIDYKSVLSLFLPAGLLDYFDITEASNMGDYFMLVLVEKDIVARKLTRPSVDIQWFSQANNSH